MPRKSETENWDFAEAKDEARRAIVAKLNGHDPKGIVREWEDYYNYHRPHGTLDEQTPYERLVAKIRAGVSPASWDSTQ